MRQDLLPAVGPSIAQPGNTALAGLAATVFKGETLQSMLLNAYGWWKVSQITYIAALAAFGLGTVAALAAGLAYTTGRRTKTTTQALPNAAAHGPVKVA